MNLEDGPAGVGDGMGGVTQLPAPVDVAATWDTSAEQTYGRVIGAEQAAKGSTVFKLDSTGRAILAILRHLGRIKESRSTGIVRFVVVSS